MKRVANFCFAIEEAASDVSSFFTLQTYTPPSSSASQNSGIFSIPEFWDAVLNIEQMNKE